MPKQKITTFLWFDDQAEEAVNFYTSLFPDSKIKAITRYPENTPGPAGRVMTVDFQLAGQDYIALNGGPQYKFTEAISLLVHCEDQQEVDRLWDKLSAGGEIQDCGWLKDRYGVSWQITPDVLLELMQDKDPEKSNRVVQAMLQMQKIDIAALQKAYRGE
jgi:predicted 3-demethylubiquinone-9 3-methyltransferase (glyoxalase superfamily)